MITLVPTGGLGNRMRAIASAIALAERAKTKLRIIWFQDWGLGCNFNELFSTLRHQEIEIELKEASFFDKYLHDRPRIKNFFIPYLFEKIQFDACLYEKEVTTNFFHHFDFLSWCQGRNVYVVSCISFFPSKLPRGAFDVFRPVPELLERINKTGRSFPTSVVGVHIRRTDNKTAIADSPIEIFIQRMHQEDKAISFYLATDSEEVKQEMKQEFGNRIITSSNKAKRNDRDGMQDALVELYTLSHTSLILGSSHSTFSITAAEIGDIQCEIIKKG